MESRGAMTELVLLVAMDLVDRPDEVTVVATEGEQATLLELRVAREDLGKVIGKQGRTARALRTIVSAAGMKARKRLVLDIVE